MNVLTLNCGSSSLKYGLYTMPEERELMSGEAQRVGPKTAKPARIVHNEAGKTETLCVDMPDHATAFEAILNHAIDGSGLILDAIGHRIVHGGIHFSEHAVVDDESIQELTKTGDLAPLHNPPAIALVKACWARYPDMKQAVIFDTTFHATIPEYAREYALPRHLRRDMRYRKYGFHGISHEYLAHETASLLGVPLEELNAVNCHLGSGGASLCAIVKGKSVDNTMGYSPLPGLVMSTRCGDIDPVLPLWLLARPGTTPKSAEDALSKRSGLLGMSRHSADLRDLVCDEGHEDGTGRRALAAKAYMWRLRKYLGAYLACVGSARAVVFADTIGETVPEVRLAACSGMRAFGMEIDEDRNSSPGELPTDVAADGSEVRILVIHTNEALAIARHAHRLITGSKR